MRVISETQAANRPALLKLHLNRRNELAGIAHTNTRSSAIADGPRDAPCHVLNDSSFSRSGDISGDVKF